MVPFRVLKQDLSLKLAKYSQKTKLNWQNFINLFLQWCSNLKKNMWQLFKITQFQYISQILLGKKALKRTKHSEHVKQDKKNRKLFPKSHKSHIKFGNIPSNLRYFFFKCLVKSYVCCFKSFCFSLAKAAYLNFYVCASIMGENYEIYLWKKFHRFIFDRGFTSL